MSLGSLCTDNVNSVCVTDLVVIVYAVCGVAVDRLAHTCAFCSVYGAVTVAFAEVFAAGFFGKSCVCTADFDIAQAATVVFVVDAFLRVA